MEDSLGMDGFHRGFPVFHRDPIRDSLGMDTFHRDPIGDSLGMDGGSIGHSLGSIGIP